MISKTVVQLTEQISVEVKVDFDYDVTPADYDCYDEAQIESFGIDWGFVGVIVTVKVDIEGWAAPRELALDSLWGIHYEPGKQESEAYLREIVAGMIDRDHIIKEAQKRIDAFAAAVNTLGEMSQDDITAAVTGAL